MASSSYQPFTVLDWIGAIFSGGTALGLSLLPLAGRAFAKMFTDFGSNVHLPLLTRLAISAWFPLILALLVIAALVTGIRSGKPLSRRRAWIVCAFGLGTTSFGLCLVGMYLPLFELADQVTYTPQ